MKFPEIVSALYFILSVLSKARYNLRSIHVQHYESITTIKGGEPCFSQAAKSGRRLGRQKRVTCVHRINSEQFKIGVD